MRERGPTPPHLPSPHKKKKITKFLFIRGGRAALGIQSQNSHLHPTFHFPPRTLSPSPQISFALLSFSSYIFLHPSTCLLPSFSLHLRFPPFYSFFFFLSRTFGRFWGSFSFFFLSCFLLFLFTSPLLSLSVSLALSWLLFSVYGKSFENFPLRRVKRERLHKSKKSVERK